MALGCVHPVWLLLLLVVAGSRRCLTLVDASFQSLPSHHRASPSVSCVQISLLEGHQSLDSGPSLIQQALILT